MADLPTRESLSRGEVRAVPLPHDVPESLRAVVEAIRSGRWNPEKQLRRAFARQAELRRRRQEEEATYTALKDTPAEPFRGKDQEFREVLWLRADSWPAYQLFDSPPFLHDGQVMHPTEWAEYTVRCPGTNFYYANKTLPLSYSLQVAVRKGTEGRVFFDGPVVMPVLFEQLGPEEDFRQEVWMGLTPMEMMTQKAGIDRARGRCVVGGLGLGWFLSEIAAKPEVREIVVVERNPELLEWVAPRLEAKFPEVKAKVRRWVAGDAYDYVAKDLVRENFVSDRKRWAAESDTCYLLDIWPAFGDADHDMMFARLEAALGDRVWGWGRHAAKIPDRAFARKKPCAECPFARDNRAGKHLYTPERIVAQAHGPFVLPCHSEPGYKMAGFDNAAEIAECGQCAGAAVFRSNVGVAGRMPKEIHVLPADPAAVFATPAELYASYYGITTAEAEAVLRETPVAELLRRELENANNRVIGSTGSE